MAAFFGICMGVVLIVGVELGSNYTQDTLYDRCVKANPTVAVGDIKAYCNERLYIKE